MSTENVMKQLLLTGPTSDTVVLTCPACGEEAMRVRRQIADALVMVCSECTRLATLNEWIDWKAKDNRRKCEDERTG